MYSKTPQSAALRSADPANLRLVFCSKSPQSADRPRKSVDFLTEYLYFWHIFHIYTINLTFCGFRNLRFFPGPKIRRFRGFTVLWNEICFQILLAHHIFRLAKPKKVWQIHEAMEQKSIRNNQWFQIMKDFS